MPFLMKLLSVISFMFLFGAAITLLPIASFTVDENSVSYRDWWLSGPGLYVFVALASFGAPSIVLLLRVNRAAQICGLSLCLSAFLVSYPELSITGVLPGLFLAAFVFFYLQYSEGASRYLSESHP